MEPSRTEIVAFVSSQILPHEGEVRTWLYKMGDAALDVDDVIQEAYCRLAALNSVVHIRDGRSYFFRTARNIVVERFRRARIVRIDSLTDIEALNLMDHEPSPERVVNARRELRRVQALIEGLPKRCREVFTLRRIHGLSQREASQRLGVTENVIEMQSQRGLRLILQALAQDPRDVGENPGDKSRRQAPSRPAATPRRG